MYFIRTQDVSWLELPPQHLQRSEGNNVCFSGWIQDLCLSDPLVWIWMHWIWFVSQICHQEHSTNVSDLHEDREKIDQWPSMSGIHFKIVCRCRGKNIFQDTVDNEKGLVNNNIAVPLWYVMHQMHFQVFEYKKEAAWTNKTTWLKFKSQWEILSNLIWISWIFYNVLFFQNRRKECILAQHRSHYQSCPFNNCKDLLFGMNSQICSTLMFMKSSGLHLNALNIISC